MSTNRTFVMGMIGVIAGCGTVLGCSLASPTYIASTQEEVDESDASTSTSSSSSSGGGAAPSSDGGKVECTGSDFAKIDLTKLKACGPGDKGGHCFARGKSPMAEELAPCAGSPSDVCVPDEIILAEGKPLKSCTSVIGKGGCVSTGFLAKMDTEGKGFLKQDVCAANQVCAPCVDPRNGGAPTPFCKPIGVHDAECSGAGGSSGGGGGGDAGPPPAPLPACCTTGGTSNGVCLPETQIPAADRAKAPALTCAAGSKCIPKSLFEGKPVVCSSILGAGVCMDKCFDQMMALAGGIGILSKANCGATELCIPCSLSSSGGGSKVPGCP